MSKTDGAEHRRHGERRAGKLPEEFLPLVRRYFKSDRYLGTQPFDTERAWIDVLYMARVSDGADHESGLTLRRGQFARSYAQLAERWGWSTMKVRRWIEKRIAAAEITVIDRPPVATQLPTTYLVVNYGYYNGDDDESDTGTELPTEGGDRGAGAAQPVECQEDVKMPTVAIDTGSDRATDTLLRNARDSKKNVLKNDSGYSPIFLEAWALYPKRPSNSKADAWKAWRARLTAKGEGYATEEEMLAGTKAYAAQVLRDRTEPKFVKMAATFYGPGLHFRVALEDAASSPARRAFDDDGNWTPEALKLAGYKS